MTFILKNPSLKDSQNYPLLRQIGLQKIENLGHELWTDYNVHDPGITFLEMLCYAITDLGYRTGFEMKDLLTSSENGLPVIKANFHSALNIFPNCPVTFKDLRKCLIDIEGVRNAWISKHESIRYCLDGKNKVLKDTCTNDPKDELCDPLNGLFDVLLEFEDTIDENDERIAILGEVKWDEASGFIASASKGLAVRAFYNFTLENVSVYTETTGNVTINLWIKKGDGSLVKIDEATKTIDSLHTKHKVDLNFELLSGYDYILKAEGSAVNLYRNTTTVNFPYQIEHLAEISAGIDGITETTNRYYFFYDWEITYGIADTELETAWGALPDPSTGTPMNASNQGLLFTAKRDFILYEVDILPASTGDLLVCLFDKNDTLLKFKKIEINTPNVLKKLKLNWEISKGKDYKIRASGIQLSTQLITNFVNNPIDIQGIVCITQGIAGTGSLNNRFHFFYNWKIQFAPSHLPKSNRTRADVQLDVRNKLHEVRNLCEDFVKIRALEFEEIGVCADVEVSPEVNIEETLAKIYIELENHIAPPVNFYTIEELLARGKTTDEIFEGPILEHGFIDHEEFCEQERRCYFRTSDIIQIIMDVPGVLAVKEITLLSFIEITPEKQPTPYDRVETLDGVKYIVKQEPWILELTNLQRFAPDLNPKRSKFMFYKNGLPYIPNRNLVMQFFDDIRATHIRPKLKGHERDLEVPLGEFKDLENYYPAQNSLPENYRVGIYKVPNSESNLRKAQAKQLKAYLLFFDQLLANYLSQLGHVKELFSWEKSTANQTYFTQKIEGIANMEAVYFDYPNLLPALESIIESTEDAEARKNRFLDHLLGRFSESFSEYARVMFGVLKEDAAAQVIEDKQDFLSDYPKLSSARGKAFNYRFPNDKDNLTGFQRRVYGLLGIRPVERRNFVGQRFDVKSIKVDGVDKFQFILTAEKNENQIIFDSIECENEHEICALLDSSLHLAAKHDNWEIADGVWKLFQSCGPDDRDEVGKLSSADNALLEETIAYFSHYANAEGFHVVEHILLRKRTTEDPFLSVEIPDEDDCDCPCVKDPYSFRASIILPSWSGRFQNIRFRQYMERVLREEAPAHVYLKICWVNHCEMLEFEKCHNDWLNQHADLNECFRGQMPLEATANLNGFERPKMESYTAALEKLIAKLEDLNNIFPTARLHDCETVSGDEPQITLNNTSLGSL